MGQGSSQLGQGIELFSLCGFDFQRDSLADVSTNADLRNLAAKHPDIVRRLKQLHDAWVVEVKKQ